MPRVLGPSRSLSGQPQVRKPQPREAVCEDLNPRSSYELSGLSPQRRLAGLVQGLSPVGGYSLHSPEAIAESLYRFSLERNENPRGFYTLLSEGLDLNKAKDLDCVRDSQAMREILTNKEQYGHVRVFFSRLRQRQDDLVRCLSFFQKIKYGPRIKSLVERFEGQSGFLDGLCAVYAEMRGLSQSAAITEVMSFVFRKDMLDPDGQETLRLYLQKMAAIPASDYS